MYENLVGILDSADRTLASALSVAPPGELDRVAHVILRLRHRIDYPEDLAVVALAGGTGSGKSSLFNQLLDSDAAAVGGVRPTTSKPLISVPRGRSVEIAGYLHWFDPADRSSHERPGGVVLIDLPDTDSVETDHRLVVENLLPRVDAVVWVVDVEKYRADSLHRGFLRRHAGHGDRFLFALNQVDRLPAAEVEAVTADFRTALIEDGFSDPAVFPVAAGPPIGPPSGIAELRDRVEAMAASSVPAKLMADLGETVSELVRIVGGAGTDFENRWAGARVDAAALAVAGDHVGSGRLAAAFFSGLAGELTGEPSEVALGISAHVGERLRELAIEAEAAVPPETGRKGWFRSVSAGVDANRERRVAHVAESLDSYAGDLIRPVLRRRAEAVADLSALVNAIENWRGTRGS
ncbi:MAG: GTPase [Acidimicrobiia bacterium]